MKLMQKMKNKKGFTLVELLVVLVILAILAAAIIPSMMGFIDKAREEAAAAECRSVLLASQIVMNEEYGLGNLTAGALDVAEIAEIADLPTGASLTSVTVASDGGTPAHFFISAASYTASNGTGYTYAATNNADGEWTSN